MRKKSYSKAAVNKPDRKTTKKSDKSTANKSEEVKIKRTVAEERNVNVPKSVPEVLEIAKLILSSKGYKVTDLPSRKVERTSQSFRTADTYISKVSFLINGMTVELYGNRLVLDDKIDDNCNAYDLKAVMSAIVSKLKTRKQNRAEIKQFTAKKLSIHKLVALVLM